jgi:hypothetical protein
VVRVSAPPDLEAQKIRIPEGCQHFLFSFLNIRGISATPPGYAALWPGDPVVSLARNHRLSSFKPSA